VGRWGGGEVAHELEDGAGGAEHPAVGGAVEERRGRRVEVGQHVGDGRRPAHHHPHLAGIVPRPARPRARERGASSGRAGHQGEEEGRGGERRGIEKRGEGMERGGS
jgi:hypothetical protein